MEAGGSRSHACGSRNGIDVVVVNGDGLHADLERVHAFLDAGVLGLLALVEEHRDRDRGENADDDDHNQQLDERETLLALAEPLHGESPLSVACATLGGLTCTPDARSLWCSLSRWAPQAARWSSSGGSPAGSMSPVALRPTLASGLPFTHLPLCCLLLQVLDIFSTLPRPARAGLE